MRVVRATAAALKYTAGRASIGLALFGCKNRPAYRIVVFPDKAYGRHHEGAIIEELGVFDPLPNYRNEKLVACDIARVKYWIGERNAHISPSLLEILGLWGVLPIHPKTFVRARHHREELEQAKSKAIQSIASHPEGVGEELEGKEIIQGKGAAVPVEKEIKEGGREQKEETEKPVSERHTLKTESEKRTVSTIKKEAKESGNDTVNTSDEGKK